MTPGDVGFTKEMENKHDMVLFESQLYKTTKSDYIRLQQKRCLKGKIRLFLKFLKFFLSKNRRHLCAFIDERMWGFAMLSSI